MSSSSSACDLKPAAMHGFLALKEPKSWPPPALVAKSDQFNRADQGNKTLANEYLDSPEVVDEKMKIVADLVRRSTFCTAYTGAGLSKAAGIPDYATKASTSIMKDTPKLPSSLDALPTKAHHVIAAMEKAGFIHHYVQQNHDGLPQKAGFPQEKINEIHGAWFDPSNPVVKFSGNLRDDLFAWMEEAEQKVDLCLCLGTSLSGMNADRMAETPAEKSLERTPKALGTVVINLQRTRLDEQAVVRVWSKLDDAFLSLARHLELDVRRPREIVLPPGDVYVIPYNAKGYLDRSSAMTLDLRTATKVKIAPEGACNFGCLGVVKGKDHEGNYQIAITEKTDTKVRRMGRWWIEAALRGAVPCIPVINPRPRVEPVGGASSSTAARGKSPVKKH